MTVDEMIAHWSPEERKAQKDLIDECREREKVIREAREKSLKGIEEIELQQRGELGEMVWMIAANWKSIGRC